jgi:Putative auto-transporter adhesin, head GIN domain
MKMITAHAARPFLVVAFALALSACDDDARPAGPVSSETRPVDSFDSIDMEGAARLEVIVGKAESLVIEGREKMISRVETDVRGDTLHIESKPRDWFISNGRPRITIKVTVPRLESLRVEGGNDVRVEGFEGGDSRIKLAGATHIKAQGYLDELEVHMAGAGHGDFSKLVADEAEVTVDGVGSVVVHPKDTLDATMNGVGAILYTGSPREVNTRMNGLGTIGRQQADDLEVEEGADDEPADEIDPDKLQPEREDKDQDNQSKKVNQIELI